MSAADNPSDPAARLAQLRRRLDHAAALAGRTGEVALLAVSKTQSAEAVRALAAAGQRAFGENYVQEAAAKRAELAGLGLEWHLIGHLQSNKCAIAASVFDWVQSVDRAKLVDALDAARDPQRGPLNVLIQVAIDDEPGKSGCRPEAVADLAARVVAAPRLRLRGLMAIPAPHPDVIRRRRAFAELRGLFDRMRFHHPGVDTLSMGMSEDFELAVAEGATLVRIGTALFGPRPKAAA